MQHTLELLAPARNLSIGIAAIDCGADAVYIAGPAFGARQAAGNSVEDIRQLCEYAHRFGVRIFVTVNTILFENELEQARTLVRELAAAGADALIVQDLALLDLCQGLDIPLHASTQCAIRTPERAAFFDGLGFSRIVPERQLSLEEIRAIRAAVGCEIECFVHGALCVCYSGQCYLSEYLDGRSANRGACMQACRSRYDLVDGAGKVLVRDKALLSLKDFNLLHRLQDLAEAGVCSFKIEGRLKSISYVRNVVRAYSLALDELVRKAPDTYRRASFGRVVEGFTPDLNKTFQRGYTQLYLDGCRSQGWSSADAPKSIGEKVGVLAALRPFGRDGMQLELQLSAADIQLRNGDGFAFVGDKGEVVGFRGDVCEGRTVRCNKSVSGLRAGTTLYRNISAAFEKEMDSQPCRRLLSVSLSLAFQPGALHVTARCEDGRIAEADFSTAGFPIADNQARMREIIAGQLAKTTGHYSFSLSADSTDKPWNDDSSPLPLLKAAFLNDIRRQMAEQLTLQAKSRSERSERSSAGGCPADSHKRELSYKENVANSLSRSRYEACGASKIEPAYELAHKPGAELMRSRYCIRHELGLCPRFQGAKDPGPLFLRNNGRLLALGFDCARCEMTVKQA